MFLFFSSEYKTHNYSIDSGNQEKEINKTGKSNIMKNKDNDNIKDDYKTIILTYISNSRTWKSKTFSEKIDSKIIKLRKLSNLLDKIIKIIEAFIKPSLSELDTLLKLHLNVFYYLQQLNFRI